METLMFIQKFEQTMVNLMMRDLRFKLPIHLKENYLRISLTLIKFY